MGNNPSKAPPTNKWQYVPRSASKYKFVVFLFKKKKFWLHELCAIFC